VTSLLVVRNLGIFELAVDVAVELFVRHASVGPCSVVIHTQCGCRWA
jgi:hypothetical protein